MPMSKTNPSARITHVQSTPDGRCRVTLMLGDQEQEIIWPGAPPVPGDIFLMSGGEAPVPVRKIGTSVPDAWSADSDALRWRRRNAGGASRMDILRKRHIIRRAVQGYFDREGFIEIDAPLLVRGTTPDAAIQSFPVGDRYLTTSTEFQIRRLEAGGFDRLYTLTKNFRMGDGAGTTRNPEFTMLEWARVGEDLAAVEKDAEDFIREAHRALGGGDSLAYQGRKISLKTPWKRMSVAEAVEAYTGAALPDFSLLSIRRAAESADIVIKDNWAEDPVFLFSILLDHIQPRLGFDQPVFLHDWPDFMTSTAQSRGGMVERSELFIAGLEFSNGFPSLTDNEAHRESFQKQIARRKAEGAPDIKLDENYIQALRLGLPEEASIALGFDRLVMLLTDQPDIRSVLAFAWDEV
ncbi:MAG: amino acid--tRNA ligase-related protein [Alphaproteobacteria bacterium]|nr:amino acid--tRNA ligase-related protein [Alphaproteobacteria bacterium]